MKKNQLKIGGWMRSWDARKQIKKKPTDYTNNIRIPIKKKSEEEFIIKNAESEPRTRFLEIVLSWKIRNNRRRELQQEKRNQESRIMEEENEQKRKKKIER